MTSHQAQLQNPRPIDIPLAEGVPLANGCIFVKLPTLNKLEEFWLEHKDKLPFCIGSMSGTYGDWEMLLKPQEWVFGPSKAAVIEAVCRWHDVGLKCVLKEHSHDCDPGPIKATIKKSEAYRADRIAAKSWTYIDQQEFDEALKDLRTKFFAWTVENIPNGLDGDDWLKQERRLNDPDMPIAEVEKAIQEWIFNEWMHDETDTRAFDAETMAVLLEIEKSDMDNTRYGNEDDPDYFE